MRIAQIGTFDLDNLGDLLFPWVTQRLIKSILPAKTQLDLQFYSPTEPTELIYSDQIPYRSLKNLDKDDAENAFDLILIGGGDLIRDDDYSLYPIYGCASPKLTFTHILSPTNTPQQRLALLGVGLPYELEDDFSAYLSNSLSRALSLGIRDERSAQVLKKSAPSLNPVIVPDFVHSLPLFLSREDCQIKVSNLLPNLNAGYFCFQGHADVCGSPVDVANTLKAVETLTGKPFVLIEIGGCLGDTEFLQNLSELTDYPVFSRNTCPNITLEQKVSIIASCDGFIGSSLHGNIISNSYGIINISYVGKYSNKIKEYFSASGNGILFKDFAHCSEDLEEIAKILTSPPINRSDFLTEKHQQIISFLKNLLTQTTAEDCGFSKPIDHIYKTAHANACFREGIVRGQLNDLNASLEAEKKNASAQINYRQALIDQLSEQLSAEKENARQQIQYREVLIEEIKKNNSVENKLTFEQLRSKDELIQALQRQLESQ